MGNSITLFNQSENVIYPTIVQLYSINPGKGRILWGEQDREREKISLKNTKALKLLALKIPHNIPNIPHKIPKKYQN